MSLRIDKRIPFGFGGQWSKVYKLYVTDDEQSNGLIYQKGFYVDIGQDVQLHCDGDKKKTTTQVVENLLDKGIVKNVRCGDSYFDGSEYHCIIDVGDIVFYENDYWVVDSVDEREIFTPKAQTIYRITMTKIFGIERR